MKRLLLIFSTITLLLLVFLPIQAQSALINVTMNRYNLSRTGANTQETTLNTSNVNAKQFGKLFDIPVIGDIYAQPLIVSGINMPGYGTRTVVYVATMHNMVYAFDADQPGDPFWKVDLGPIFDANISGDIPDKEVGVLSTPVIDLATQTLYLVSQHNGNPPIHKIHALDLTTGQEKFGGPVDIRVSVPGTGYDNHNGTVTLDSHQQLQRPGLLLLKGTVYVAFGSTAGDSNPYHGWLLGYDASDLQKMPLVWNSTPNGGQGGIWMTGTAPSVDAEGNMYLAAANGSFSVQGGGIDYGQSLIKFNPANGLTPIDFFTPYNQAALSLADVGIGSTGTILIPDTTLLIAGTKSCELYLLDTTRMGKYREVDNTQINQSFCGYNGALYSAPLVWNSPNGTIVYMWALNDYIKAFKLDGDKLLTTPVSTSVATSDRWPGGVLGLSSNGNQPGTGILWAVNNHNQFYAMDATDLTHVLFSDEHFGVGAKFVSPTIANGKVYLPTHSNKLVVYGLLRAAL